MLEAVKGFFVSDAFWVAFTLLVVVVLIINRFKERGTGSKRDNESSEYYDGCAEYYEDLDSFSTRK